MRVGLQIRPGWGSEAKTARANGEAVRSNHKGTPYRTVSPISTEPYKEKK